MSELPPIDPARKPIVQFVDGEAIADSRDVAAYFNKNHRDVLRDIRNLLHKEPSLGLRNFAPFKINDLTGESTSHVMMDRDGFSLLVMGFTGGRALRFKMEYIAEFNAMESELRRRKAGTAQIDVTDMAQLSTIALQLIGVNKDLQERAETAEKKIEADKPKTGFFDRFMNADGVFGLQNAGRILIEPPNKFVGWLKQQYLFYQGGDLVPRAQYRTMGIFEVKVTMVDDKARHRTYVTPKGIQYLAKKLGKDIPDLGMA